MANITVTFSKTTPAAPAGADNVEWQSDGAANPHISANVKEATASVKGTVQLAGDLAGSSASPVVAKVQGTAVKSGMAPADGEVFAWSSANSRWQNFSITVLGGANAVQLRGVNILSTQLPVADGQVLTYDGANWRPREPQPYRVQEAHADSTGNIVGMYTGSGSTFRWATNNANLSTFVNATATEKLLYQMGTATANTVVVYANNQSNHIQYTLGNVKRYRSRVGLLATTSERFYIGLADFTNLNPNSDWTTDTPAHNFVGFRYSTNAGETNFMMCAQTDATHQTVTSTGVAIDTAMHVFEFYYDGAAVQFFIDGNNVGSISTNLMATSVRMDQVIALNLIGSGSKSINLDYVAIYW